MNEKLHPVTFDLPDELIAELSITAHAKGMTLEEWVTILVKQAINELPAQADENQTREFALAQSGTKILDAKNL